MTAAAARVRHPKHLPGRRVRPPARNQYNPHEREHHPDDDLDFALRHANASWYFIARFRMAVTNHRLLLCDAATTATALASFQQSPH